MNTETHTEKNITQARFIFFVICGGFIIGDILGITRNVLSLAVLVIGLFFLYTTKRQYKYIFLVGILSMSIGYSFGKWATEKHDAQYTSLKQITGNFSRKMEITGKVDKLVFQKERTSVYKLYIDNFDTIDNFDKNKKNLYSYMSTEHVSTSLFIEIPSNLTINIWDTVSAIGSIKENVSFPLSGYSRYAYFQKWFGILNVSEFKRIKKEDPHTIDAIKSSWEKIFISYFPSDIAGTLLGMTIGSIDILSRETKNAFIASGTSHILVVSGANIAFLIIILTFFLKYLPLGKTIRATIVCSFILFYGTLVWWDVSVVRATIMGILSYIIVEYGSRWSSVSIFALTWVILTAISPLSPVFDAGFGLSFSATFGILVFHPMIEKWCKKYNIPHSIVSIISVSIGAMMGSLPMIIYHFERIPLASLLANILIGGILGWILFSCVFFVWIQFISHTLAIFSSRSCSEYCCIYSWDLLFYISRARLL
jgi:ComEC/Rec2-related protein